MTDTDRAKLKKFQPFCYSPPNWKQSPLRILFAGKGLSNIDKHRTLHLVYSVPYLFKMISPKKSGEGPLVEFFDCRAAHVSAEGEAIVYFNRSLHSINAGDEIARIPIIPAGPNPNTNLTPELTYGIAVGDPTVPAIDVLEFAANMVEGIIAALIARNG